MLSQAAQDVARGAAQALASKLGAKFPDLTDAAINAWPLADAGALKRSGVPGGAELFQVAGFVVAVAHLAVSVYHASKDRSEVAKSVKAQMKAPAGMTGQQADEIVGAVVTQVEKQKNG